MGRIIAEKVRGMNWKAKISLILIFTMAFSTFMYQGWYRPQTADSAITYQSAGTLAYSSNNGTTVTPAYPASIAAGNLLVLMIGMKPSSANGGSVTTPGGWTPIVSLTGAGGYGTTLGADEGNTNLFTYYKIADGTETGNLGVTLATNDVSWAQIHRLTGTVGGWSVAGATGSDTSAGNVSVTFGSNPGVTTGDYILGAICIPTDVTTPSQFSGEAFSQSGVTFGTVTEVSEPDSNVGRDIGGFVVRAAVSSGTGTGNPAMTATAGGTTTNVRGPAVFIRIREAAAAAPSEVAASLNAAPQFNNTFVGSPMTITENFTSTPAVNACQYTINGGSNWSAGAVSGTGPYICTASGVTAANGTALTIQMRASNNGGSSWSTVGQSLSRTADAAAPTTTASAGGYVFDNWTGTSPLAVTLAASDAAGSGAANTQYCVDTTNTCTPGTAGTSLNVTCAAGSVCTQYVRYRSTDNVNNLETTKSSQVRQDLQAPVIPTLVSPADEAVNQALNTTLTCNSTTDSGSGGVQYYFDVVDTGTYAVNSGWIAGTSFAPPGLQSGTTYTWKVKARDAAGNESAFSTPRSFSTVQPCFRNDPTLDFISATVSTVTTDGGTANYTLRVTNHDSGSCSDTTFSHSATEVSDEGDNFVNTPSLSSYNVTLSPGASQDVTLGVTARAGKTAGRTKTMVSSAADVFHGAVNSSSATTNLNVATCTAYAPQLSIGPDEGNVAVGGTLAYNISVKNVDVGAACASVNFTVSIVSENPATPNTNFNQSALTYQAQNGTSVVLSLNPGQTGTAGLTVSAKSGAAIDAVSVTTIGVTAPAHATPAQRTATTTVGNRLLHNSINIQSTRWSAAGGWGIPGGKYGEFICDTCHTLDGSTNNIKKIRQSITTPDPSKGLLPGDGQTIVFTRLSGSPGDPGLPGDDSNTPRTSSNRICEVCHTYDPAQVNGVNVHAYNSQGQNLGNHQNANAQDCISCHQHNKGFLPAGCNSCHGDPPTDGTLTNYADKTTGSTTAGKHEAHVTTLGYTCEQCHNNTVMPQESTVKPGFWDISIQFNNYGVLTGTYSGQAGLSYNNTLAAGGQTCSTVYCHGSTLTSSGAKTNPLWTSAATSACGDCHGAKGGAGTTWPTTGAHALHTGTGGAQLNLSCSDCHGATAGAQGHVTGNVSWALDTAKNIFGANAKYNSAAGGTTTGIAPSSSYGSCATLYCHSSVQNDGGTALASYAGTPSWSGGPLTCSTAACHGNAPATGKHGTHVTTYAFTCAHCHNNAGKDTALHGNYLIEVAFNAFSNTGAAYTGGTVNGNHAPGGGYGDCSNTYCHSNGTSATGSHGVLSWSGTMNAECSSCHGGNAAATTKIITNVHGVHTNDTGNKVGRNIGCAECHSATASADRTVSSFVYHVNKNVNVRFDNSTLNKDTDLPTYNGSDARSSVNGGASKAAGSAVGSCSNLYCHSVGNLSDATGSGTVVAAGGTSFRSIAWNAAAIGCDSCHGDQAGKSHPIYTTGAAGSTTANSHVKHVEGSSLSCDYCHNTTTTDTTVPPTTVVSTGAHLNRIETVSFKSNGGKTGTYDPTVTIGKTCSTTYCHGTGPSVQWGGTTNCASCHGASNNGDLSSGTAGHAKHYQSATAPSAITGGNGHTTSAYVFACSACHPTGTHSQGPADSTGPVFQDAQIGGTKQTSGNYTQGGSSTTDAKGFNFTNGTCSTVCHTRDGATLGSGITATPAWNGTNALGCGYCHNKAGDASPTWSTPHTKHINTYSANTNITCEACHTGTAASNTALQATAAARNQHPDAAKNVAFGAFAGGTWSGTQCSNTYCHSNGTSATPTHTAISWTGTYSTCAECHGNAASIATGSHTKHMAVSGVTCTYCHNATASNNTTIVAGGYVNHINKSVTINFNATVSGAGATYNGNTAGGATVYQKTVGTAGGSCNTTNCHGSSSPAWGSDTTNDTCTKCHGTGTVTVNTANRYVVAPPKNTAGGSGTATGTGQVDTTANSKIGAHQTHVRYLNGLRSTANDTNDDRCAYCHGTLPATANHANGSSVPAFQGLATRSGAMSPTYGGLTCTNTYCHNPAGTGGTLSAANTGTGVAPSWTNAAYIADGTLKTISNCGVCHKSPWDAGFTSSYAHGTMTTATDCSGCHGHNGETSGSAGQRHMDGVRYGAGACNSCHGYEATSWAGATERAVEGKGAHAKHVAHLVARWGGTLNPATDQFGSGLSWTNVCGVCHNGATHTTTEAIGGNGRQISILATYQFGASAPSYSGVPATSSSVNRKSCSSVSCHFSTTPVWSAY